MTHLRTKIFSALALTVLLTVGLLGAMSYFILVEALSGLQRRQLVRESKVMAEKVEEFFADRGEVLTQVEGVDYYGRMGDLPLAKHLASFQEFFPVLGVVNRSGREDIRLIEGDVAFYRNDWNDSEVFARSLEHPNEVVFSDVQYSQDLKAPVIWAAVSRFGYFGDEFLGTTIGAIPLREVVDFIREYGLNESGHVALVDSHGTVLSHPDSEYSLGPLPVSGSKAIELLNDVTNLRPAFLHTTVFNTDSFVAMTPVAPLKWQVLALLSHDRFMQAPNRQRLLTLVVCVAMLALGLTVSMLFARRLTRRIGQFIHHTDQVAAGDLSQRLEIDSNDEMEQLAQSFNTMTRRLERANQARETVDRILQSIIDPLFVLDRTGRISDVNSSALSLLGCEPDQIVGEKFNILFPPQSPLHREHKLLDMLAEGPVRNVEAEIRTQQKTTVPVLFSCSLTGTEGHSSGMVAILKDISQRKHAEQGQIAALRAAEEARERIDAILKSVGDGLIATDCEGRIILLNPVAENFLGLQMDRVINRSAAEVILHPELRGRLFYAPTRGVSASEEDLEIDDPKSGRPRFLRARTTAVRKQDGEVSGFLTLLHDVTHERQMDRMKSEFISTAAHELRTPLTSIIGYGELLTSPESFGEFSPEQREEFVREIVTKAENLCEIVNELLDISRIESGQPLQIEKKPCDLGALLSRIVRHFNAHSPQHNLVLNLPDDDLEDCWIDENKIVQVMENLISNAVKYSPRGGEIQVRAARAGGSAQIEVKDQGIGMDEEQVSHIFDKFYRVDASDTAVGGLGLGMSIVHNIIEAHDGGIQVDSRPGAGTTVTLTLPVAPLAERQPESAARQS